MPPLQTPCAPSTEAFRETAARLLKAVVDEEVSPRQAINRWPVLSGFDPSLDTAYQALLHFEADEDRQREELFYLDTQLELLGQMAGFLSKNKNLPLYMIRAYSREHSTGFYHEIKVLFTPLQNFLESAAACYTIIKNSLLR